MTDIREEPWFFQEMAPLLATAVLKPLADGAFLVRSFKRRLALSFVCESGVKHMWIHRDEDGQCYVFRHEKFPTIREMIDRYRGSRSLGVQLLRYPLPENVEQFLRLPSDDIELGPESTDGTDSQLTSFHHGRFGDEAVTAVSRRYNSGEITACLRNEASILMLLDHPNVLRLMGLHHPNHSQYALVVEHVNSGNLRQFLRRQGDTLLRDWEILVSFTHQVASGLAYLHKKSIVHCDVVLENCLIERTDRFTVKLAGLLFARFEGTEPHSQVQLLWRRCCRVSPPSPESSGEAVSVAITGTAPLPQPPTAASDVWAFGLLMWSAFTLGRCHQLTEPFSLGCGHLPHELACSLEHLVRSCLYELPQLRISSSELSKQLRNLMDLRSQLCEKYAPPATYGSLGTPFSSSGVPSPSPSSNQMLSSSDAGCSSADSSKKERKPRMFFRRSKKWKSTQANMPRSHTVDGGLQREEASSTVLAPTPPMAATVSNGGNGGGSKRRGGLRHLFSRNRSDRGRNTQALPGSPSTEAAAEISPSPPTPTIAVPIPLSANAAPTAASAATRILRSQSDYQIGVQLALNPGVKQGRATRLGQVAEYAQAESVTSVTSQLTESQRTDSSFQLSAGGGSIQEPGSISDGRYERLLAQARQLRARYQAERLAGQELRRRLESCEVRLADTEAEARQWRQEAALRQRQTVRLRQEAADAQSQLLTMRADYERLLAEFTAVEARLLPSQPVSLPPPPQPLELLPPPPPLIPHPLLPPSEPIGSHDSGIGLGQSESAYSLARSGTKAAKAAAEAAPVPLRPPRPVRATAISATPMQAPPSPITIAHHPHQRYRASQHQNHNNQLRPHSEA